MITHHSSNGLVWLDTVSPDDKEIADLIKRYGLHSLVGEELKSSSSLAKIDFYKDYILVVLTLPIRNRTKNGNGFEIVDREIDFVIGKNFIITTRFDAVEELEYFAKVFEANSILNKEEKIEHAGHLFYYMIKRVYQGMKQDLDNIKDSIITAEDHIFSGDERSMVKVLSNLSRELIDFTQTIRIHEGIWEELTKSDNTSFFGKEFAVYMRDMRDEFNGIRELIANARELLTDLRKTNDSLLNTRQNDIIKLLATISFVFSPLIFISALFTIPAINVPIIEHGGGWYGILIFMIVLSGILWWYFKKKKWI